MILNYNDIGVYKNKYTEPILINVQVYFLVQMITSPLFFYFICSLLISQNVKPMHLILE